MRIAIIGTTASSFYGFRLDLIKKLIELNYEVYAFTSEYTQNDLVKIEALGVIPKTYYLQRGGVNVILDAKTLINLTKQIKEINPDIVFSYFSKPVIYGTLAAKFAKTPKIVGMIEGLGYTFTEQPGGDKLKTKLIRRLQIELYRVVVPKLDKFILLNPDDPIDLLEKYSIPSDNVEILGGIGLNLQDYDYSPPPKTELPIHFIFVARLIKEKGINDFVTAAKKVKSIYPNTVFTVLGAIDKSNPGGLSEEDLQQLISSGIINYPGHVENVQDWVAKSHVFVLPSYYREGVPRSTQEAMAIGRPIITTDVPGCRETVINGVNGFLVDKWNPEALAVKMIYFIENPEQIEKMGLESYKIAKERFDSEKTNQKLIEILGL